jgi:NitT/TauT family transport system ATP-binding protein
MLAEIHAKRFGATQVLGEIALEVAPGEIVALAGPSGVGKTTLVRILAGLDPAFEGRVADAGRVAMVFQSPTLLPWRTAEANIRLTTGAGPEAVHRLLAEVGLEGRADAFPGQLSLGQQRRLALARALAAEPETLLMDEPFVSLDEETAARMRALTLDLLAHRRIATLIVTHDLIDAAEMADRVVVLAGRPAVLENEHLISAPRGSRDVAAEVGKLRGSTP